MESIFQSFANNFTNFFTTIWNFFSSFIVSLFWFIWYWWKTLITWVWKLLYYVSGLSVFDNVSQVLTQLSVYIWPYWVLFIASMLSIIIVWILFSFVMKIFKWHNGYKAMFDKDKYYDIRDRLKK